MTDAQKIRQIERQLADCDSAPDADEHEKIDILNELAWVLRDTDLQRTQSLSETAQALAESSNDGAEPYRLGLAYSLRTLGYLNFRRGNYPLSFSQSLEAQQIFESLEHLDGLHDVFENIASIYTHIGNIPEAFAYFYKQLDAAQRLDDKKRIADASNNLAVLHDEIGEIERAIEIWRKNLKIAIEIDHKRVQFLCFQNLASIYVKQNDTEKALKNGLAALRISREAGFESLEIYALHTLGEAHFKIDDVAQALDYLEQALTLSEKLDAKPVAAYILWTIAQVYRAQQDLDRALDCLVQGIALAESIDDKRELFKPHLLASEIYEQQGDFAQALQHFKQYQKYREAVLDDKANQQMRILQVTHDTETVKKEAEIYQLKTVQLEQEIEIHTSELSDTITLLQREIGERERAEAEIQQMVEELEQRVADRSRDLAALYDMTILFTESHNLADVLKPALEKICDSIDGNGIAVHVLAADRSQLQLTAHVSLIAWAQMQQMALTPEFANWLQQTDAPVMLVGYTDAHPFIPSELLSSHHRTFLGIALRVRDEVIGVLGVYRKVERPFSVQTVSLLITMAEQLGIIIQNYQLQEQSRHMTQAIERQRLARELHDSVAQRLYSLNLFARAGRDALADGDLEDAQLRLRQVEENARYTLREMRLLLYQLRPLALENQTLVAAFEERFALVERQLGIVAVIQANTTPELTENVEKELYYIISEALNNGLKHAQATRVDVRFDAAKSRLLVTIRDNGQGFDLTKPSSGSGLKNMYSRAAQIKGELDIETAVGKGTTIRISV